MDRSIMQRLRADAIHAHDAALVDRGWEAAVADVTRYLYETEDGVARAAAPDSALSDAATVAASMRLGGVDAAVEGCAALAEAITLAQSEMRAAIARLDVLAVEMRRIVDAAVVAAEVDAYTVE